MEFKEKLKAGRFVILAELNPPKGVDTKEFLENALILKGRVDAILVTDMSGSIMRMSSICASRLLLEKGVTPIFQISSAHKNRLAIQGDLLGAYALGLTNLFAIKGGDPSIGDHYEAKAVYDLQLMDLLDIIKRLQEGYDQAGADLVGAPQFCSGTIVNAGVKEHVLDLEIMEMEEKVRKGVDYFITTPVFDLTAFSEFKKKISHFTVPVIASVITVIILKSAGMARYINKHMEGVKVPDSTINRIIQSPDKMKVSVEIASELIKGLKEFCQGVLIIPIGWETRIPQILDSSAL
ncbi:MAG: methylenetetrahydrofolate reductase [Deltaproteobacteria bacterium]|nr:methylenetetrahydrofolate reductase [Deltaproteobacteria bacterium]